MHPAWSIIFFTSASGLGLGLAGWIVLGYLDLTDFIHLIYVSGFTFGLIGAGLLSSTLHLYMDTQPLGSQEIFMELLFLWQLGFTVFMF